jgi:hypothetical protein
MNGQFWLTLIFLLAAFVAAYMPFRTGKVFGRHGIITREDSPSGYWFQTLFFIALTLGLLWVFGYGLYNLFTTGEFTLPSN